MSIWSEQTMTFKLYKTDGKEDEFVNEFGKENELYTFIFQQSKNNGIIRYWEEDGWIFIDYGSWDSYYKYKKV